MASWKPAAKTRIFMRLLTVPLAGKTMTIRKAVRADLLCNAAHLSPDRGKISSDFAGFVGLVCSP
jgi:hypothetical protein